MKHERFTDGSTKESGMQQLRTELQSHGSRDLPAVAETDSRARGLSGQPGAGNDEDGQWK